MKATPTFSKIIEDHLKYLALNDELFATTLAKPNKNITDCVNYILSEVKKSGCTGFADDEIFAMAVHYYDEDNLKPVNAVKATVVVNHTGTTTKAVAPPVIQKPGVKKPAKQVIPQVQISAFD